MEVPSALPQTFQSRSAEEQRLESKANDVNTIVFAFTASLVLGLLDVFSFSLLASRSF
jgi:hypothetical protein